MNGAVRRVEWRTEERRSQVAVDGQTLAGRFSADARYQLNTSRFIQRTGGGRFFNDLFIAVASVSVPIKSDWIR